MGTGKGKTGKGLPQSDSQSRINQDSQTRPVLDLRVRAWDRQGGQDGGHSGHPVKRARLHESHDASAADVAVDASSDAGGWGELDQAEQAVGEGAWEEEVMEEGMEEEIAEAGTGEEAMEEGAEVEGEAVAEVDAGEHYEEEVEAEAGAEELDEIWDVQETQEIAEQPTHESADESAGWWMDDSKGGQEQEEVEEEQWPAEEESLREAPGPPAPPPNPPPAQRRNFWAPTAKAALPSFSASAGNWDQPQEESDLY